MGSVPREVNGIPGLWFTPIDGRHRPTGACRHLSPSGPLGPAAGLLICGYQESSVYLHSCDEKWVPFTDTWHGSVEEAKRQAEFEYTGSSATWQRVAETATAAAWSGRVSELAHAWRANLPWREDYLFWTARALSKTGSLEPHDEVLIALGESLSRDEALWLYARLQESRRGEGEWRAEFRYLFPQVSATDLPPLPPGELLREYPRRRPMVVNPEPTPDTEIPF